jgi:hypothetical protein
MAALLLGTAMFHVKHRCKPPRRIDRLKRWVDRHRWRRVW